MNKKDVISIVEIVGSGHCTASEDGQKIYQAIISRLKDNNDVILSFQNVEDLTSAFLNAAVGQLYSELSEQHIKDHLSVVDASQDNLVLLKRVVDRAKEFFKNPDRIKKITRNLLGDADDA